MSRAPVVSKRRIRRHFLPVRLLFLLQVDLLSGPASCGAIFSWVMAASPDVRRFSRPRCDPFADVGGPPRDCATTDAHRSGELPTRNSSIEFASRQRAGLPDLPESK